MDIANTSLAIDPWYLWCKSDPDQAAVSEAVYRSVAYAMRSAVTPVSSLGNINWDLVHDIVDLSSPTNGPAVTRNTDASWATVALSAATVAALATTPAGDIPLDAALSTIRALGAQALTEYVTPRRGHQDFDLYHHDRRLTADDIARQVGMST
ncbi:hypothetical protein [Amycolatopsis sp. cmx-11-32]|uniref:hypothetical protein n=1 Tax=Amycolatopsis sp. cmx-11-32 TaxID=2785796 RepID=UPI0039E35A6A